MKKTAWVLALLALAALAWPADHALADPPWSKGAYKHWSKGAYKHKPGYKLKYKKWAGGGPPPWAPAHGYRSKHGGSAAYAPPFGIGLGQCNREVLGGLLGGAIGGYAGSHIGKGSGRTAAIIGGALAGVLIGGSIGRSMDGLDQHCVGQILEHAPPDQTVAWNNPDTGARYRVTPMRTYQENAGRYCREYQTVSVIGGRQRQTYGTACRQPDGSWQLIS